MLDVECVRGRPGAGPGELRHAVCVAGQHMHKTKGNRTAECARHLYGWFVGRQFAPKAESAVAPNKNRMKRKEGGLGSVTTEFGLRLADSLAGHPRR